MAHQNSKKKTSAGRGRNTPAWRQLLLNTWAAETAALVFSTACLIAIAIVLGVYDSKTQPQLPYGLTLNAIISVLAIGSKSPLIFTVAAALGQLKWVWFQRSRKLQDVQLFDDASRGAWGSITMLKRVHFRSLASIGALVTILAVAFEPFVQQILKYPTKHDSRPDSAASVRKHSVFNVDAVGMGLGTNIPGTFSYDRALQAGLWSTEDQFQQIPSCPTGNCNWPVHRSVGLCTRCTDAKPYAKIESCNMDAYRTGKTNKLNCYLSFGHGNALNILYGEASNGTVSNGTASNRNARTYEYIEWAVWVVDRVTVTNRGKPNRTHPLPLSHIPAFHDIPDPGLVLGRASARWGINDVNKAPELHSVEECVITHCAMDYNVSVIAGDSHFDPVKTHYGIYSVGHGFVQDYQESSYNIHNPSHVCWQSTPGNVIYEPGHVGILPNVDQHQTGQFRIQVNYTYNAICPVEDQLKGIAQTLTGDSWYKWQVYGENQDPSSPSSSFTFGMTNSHVATIVLDYEATVPLSAGTKTLPANGLEPALQRIAGSLTKLNLDVGNETVSGNATFSVFHVHVEWAWLGLPIALELFGITFLVIAILTTRLHRAQLWKSSVLPLLLHGLSEDTVRVGAIPADLFGMEKVAKKVEVQLGGTKEDSGPDNAEDVVNSRPEERLLLTKVK